MSPSPNGPLLERIAACDELTPGEAAVARFYEDGYPGVALLKLQQVSAAAGVSTATVARFAHKLGYADFRELSAALQEEVSHRLTHPRDRLAHLAADGSAQAGPGVLADRLAIAESDLRESADRLDPATFDAVVGLVADAQRPLFLGAVASGQPFLQYAALLLRYLRGGVTVLDGTDRWAHDLAGMPSDAVVLAVAVDRYPIPVQRLLQFARERGAATVLITNRRSSPLVRDADHVLFVASRTDTVFRSRLGLMFVLEALLDAVGRLHPEGTERATDIEQFFSVMGGYLPQPPPGSAASEARH